MQLKKSGTKISLGLTAKSCSILKKPQVKICLKTYVKALIAQFVVKSLKVNKQEPNTKRFDLSLTKKLQTRQNLKR
jgi:hypothetical protein